MRDLPSSRLFRALICLLLICSLFFSYAAIPARAFAFAEVAIPAIAVIFMYLVMQTGFIPPPDITISNLQEIDQSMRSWYGDFDISFRNPDDPWPDDLDDEESDLSNQLDKIKDAINNGAASDTEKTIKVSQDLLEFFKLFLLHCFHNKDAPSIPLLGEEAPEGYAYYNGYCLPTVIDISTRPYHLIFYGSDGLYYDVQSATPVKIYDLSTDYYINSIFCEKTPTTSTSAYLFYLNSSQSWYVDDSWGSYSSFNLWTYSKRGSYTLIWANHDIIGSSGSVVFSVSPDPLTQEEAYLEAVAILGETAQGIQDGTLTQEDIELPEYINVSEFFANISDADGIMQNYNQIAQELQDGTRDYNEFAQSMVASAPSTDDGTTDDSTGSDSVTDGTLANHPVLDFFSKLGELLQAISSGNIVEIGNIIQDRVTEIRGDIDGVDSTLQEGFQDVVDSNQSLNDSVQDFAEQQNQMMQEQNQVIEDQSQSLGDRLLNGVQSLFTPSDGFIEGKIDDLRNEYAFADSIALTAVDLKRFLTSLGSVPPVIRINLGAATGSFNWGGDMVLIDFSFYEPYKPTMDAILSAFLWLWFCWRVILGLPGIIGGASGLSGAFHDSSHVGSSGYVSTPNSNAGVTKASQPEKPKFVPRPGGDTHYKEWAKDKNPADYYYRGKDHK